MIMSFGYCSQFDADDMESLIATAPKNNKFLLYEYWGTWGSHISSGSTLGAETTAQLEYLAAELEATLVLIKCYSQKYRGNPLGHTIFYSSDHKLKIYTSPSGAPLAIPTATQMEEATLYPEPIFLICTNGKRDKCCAIFGRKLIRELVNRGYERNLWECSHLGGHRYAPIMLTLPSGYCYGRLTTDQASEIMAYSKEDVVYAGGLRGRAGDDIKTQIADCAIRQNLEPKPADDIKILSHTQCASYHRIKAYFRNRDYLIDYRIELTEPRPASCGDEPKKGTTIRILAVSSKTSMHA